jgi:hypothetical protein
MLIVKKSSSIAIVFRCGFDFRKAMDLLHSLAEPCENGRQLKASLTNSLVEFDC